MTLRQILAGIAYVILCGITATTIATGEPTNHYVGGWTFSYKPAVIPLFSAGIIVGMALLILDRYFRSRFR